MNKEEEIAAFRRDIFPAYERLAQDEPYGETGKPPGIKVKQCRICGEYKRLSAFYKNPLKKLGRFDECKQCLKLIRMKRKRS